MINPRESEYLRRESHRKTTDVLHVSERESARERDREIESEREKDRERKREGERARAREREAERGSARARE